MTFDAVGAAWFVLDTSLRALAAALAVALVLRLLRVRAAAVLHSAWSAVLFAMLLMPVLPSIVPALPVPVPAAAGDFFDAASGTEEPSPAVVGHSTPARNGINAVPSPQCMTQRDRVTGYQRPTPVRAPRARGSRLCCSSCTLRASFCLSRDCRTAGSWHRPWSGARCAAVPFASDVGRHVYESPEVTVPMTVGAMRPVIVLPIGWRTWDRRRWPRSSRTRWHTCVGTMHRSPSRLISTVRSSGSIRWPGGSSGNSR